MYMGLVWTLSVCMSSSPELLNFIQIYKPGQSYDVKSIFQDGGRDVAILVPILFLVTSLN